MCQGKINANELFQVVVDSISTQKAKASVKDTTISILFLGIQH